MNFNSPPVHSGRRYPRIYQELPFSFRVLGPEREKEWILTKTKMLGGGGMSVTSPVLLPIGTVLHGKLKYYARVIEFTAEIVWVENVLAGESSQARYGLSFSQISQEDLLSIHDIINTSKNRKIQTD